MDGTRKTPPGHEARNLSRRDGIRAGSVSGPWRSVPKADDAPRDKTTPSMAPPGWTGREPAEAQPEHDTVPDRDQADRPESGPEPREGPVADPTHRGAVPLRGTRGMAAWIVFGLGIAVALVAAAVYLRPAPVAPVAEPAEDSAPASVAEPDAVVVDAPADPAPAAETGIVRLRVGPDADPAEIARITDGLEARGLGPVRVETLPFAITQSRVGYYRPEDEAAARALADIAGPLIGAEDDVGLRDYGDLLADTKPGRLDLWLGE